MIEDFLNDYTAKEFLDWLEEEYADEYIKQIVDESLDGETYINDVFDIEALIKNFSRQVRKYTIVKRGYRFFIHDERNCVDIMTFRYNDDNYEEVSNYVNDICDNLNKGNINFIGKKHRCG